jgi:hypothetical protein
MLCSLSGKWMSMQQWWNDNDGGENPATVPFCPPCPSQIHDMKLNPVLHSKGPAANHHHIPDNTFLFLNWSLSRMF